MASIVENHGVRAEIKALEQARREGAMALFGEKYGDQVRAVIIETGDKRYSYELCGGAHVGRTAEIGAFVFTSEGSVSAGIRRVEALTGHAANQYLRQRLDTLDAIVEQLGAAPGQAQTAHRRPASGFDSRPPRQRDLAAQTGQEPL